MADAWLSPPDLRPVGAPAALAGMVRGLADIGSFSINDPLAGAPAVRQSAVLVLVTESLEVLLQQRSASLRKHAGQVSFPGGVREPGDAGPVGTALREAEEETGLDPDGVDALVVLPRVHIPPTGFDVTGVVAWWRTPSPVRAVDPAETERVMSVSLLSLADPAGRFVMTTDFGWRGPAFFIDGAVIWGYTAEVLVALLRCGGWEVPWESGAREMTWEEALREAGTPGTTSRE